MKIYELVQNAKILGKQFIKTWFVVDQAPQPFQIQEIGHTTYTPAATLDTNIGDNGTIRIPSVPNSPCLSPHIRHRNTDAPTNETATNTETMNPEIATELFEIAKCNLRCLVTVLEKHNKIKSILTKLGKDTRDKELEIEKVDNEIQFIRTVYPDLSSMGK
jgi:hypothetical protein